MGDEEDYYDDEDEVKPVRPPNNRQTILLSFLRQFYCCSAALLFPIFVAVIEHSVYIYQQEDDFFIPIIFGEIIGTLCCGIFIFFLGRKLAIIISSIFFSILIMFSFFTFYGSHLLYSPILTGLLMQFATVVFLFYVAEICTATFRAFFMGFYYTNLYLGRKYILDTKVNEFNIPLLVSAALAFLSSIMSFVVPESPYYLAVQGNLEKAEEIFTWIRGGNADTVEYDLMLDKAQRRFELGEIFKPTFAVCMLMCILLTICNVNGCELLQIIYFNYHLKKDKENYIDVLEFIYVYGISYLQHSLNMATGSFLFSCASLVISRKIIYGSAFIITILMAVSLVFSRSPYATVRSSLSVCSVVTFAGREPLAMILPVEILPTVMRTVGLMILYTFQIIIQIYLYYTSVEERFAAWRLSRVGKTWIILSYSVSLIGVPFLLIFMPETKGRSIFELEEVKLSFPFRKKASEEVEDIGATE